MATRFISYVGLKNQEAWKPCGWAKWWQQTRNQKSSRINQCRNAELCHCHGIATVAGPVAMARASAGMTPSIATMPLRFRTGALSLQRFRETAAGGLERLQRWAGGSATPRPAARYTGIPLRPFCQGSRARPPSSLSTGGNSPLPPPPVRPGRGDASCACSGGRPDWAKTRSLRLVGFWPTCCCTHGGWRKCDRGRCLTQLEHSRHTSGEAGGAGIGKVYGKL